MTVIDLIIKLQQLPPNMEVMLDHTRDESAMFKFVEVNYVDKVDTEISGEVVIISPIIYEETEDFLEPE